MSVLGLAVAACGGGGDDDGASGSTSSSAAQVTTTTSGTGTTVADPGTTTTSGSSATGTQLTISAIDSEGFSTSSLQAPAGEITITFDNKDPGEEPHNIRVVIPAGDVFTPVTNGPDIQSMTFTIDTPGDYAFFCDTHTDAMNGTLTVNP
jgi:plastocyanin